MADWTIAISAFGALVGFGFLGHAVLRQILEHIEKESRRVEAHVDRRFDEAERRRSDASKVWAERFSASEQRIDRLAADIAKSQAEHPVMRAQLEKLASDVERDYLRRDVWIEAEGRSAVKLDKLLERIERLSNEIQSSPRNCAGTGA
jgi:chromosome segregation ATPase